MATTSIITSLNNDINGCNATATATVAAAIASAIITPTPTATTSGNATITVTATPTTPTTTINNNDKNKNDIINGIAKNSNGNNANDFNNVVNRNHRNNESNNGTKNIRKLHPVNSAAEYVKSNYQNTKSLSTSLLGQVLIGTHIETGRIDCIKMCLKEIQKSLSDRIAENPQREIETMEAVCTQNHPYLIDLIDAVEDSKLHVTIEEYVANGDMCSYLQKLGHGLPETQARKYFKQLVEAIAFMHNKGYCHLDISLENILLDEANDCIKLCDFGLSRPLHQNKPFPASHIRPGKINYIAPEIISYQPFYGDKADSFSLGVILFMFLTGFPPFKMASTKDICFRYFFSGRTETLLREWKLLDMISIEARDLLSKIFTQPGNRISVQDMLNHPWVSFIH